MVLTCHLPNFKISLDYSANRNYVDAHPAPPGGDETRRHVTLVRVAMDAVASVRAIVWTRRLQRTAKSCGPGAATLASIRPACAGTATVAIKAVHRGEHEGNRETIARGRPGCPGCTCGLTRVRFFYPVCTRDCGRSRRPVFPAPSDRRGSNEIAKPGQNTSRE